MTAEKWGPGGGNGPQPNDPENPYIPPEATTEDSQERISARAREIEAEMERREAEEESLPECDICGCKINEGDDSTRIPRKDNGVVVNVHAVCLAKYRAKQDEQRRRADQATLKAERRANEEELRRQYAEEEARKKAEKFARLMTEFPDRMARKLAATLPPFRPVVGSPEFERAVKHQKLRTVAKKYSIDRGHLLLLGPSGCGKTTTATAIVQNVAAQYVPEQTTADKNDGFGWSHRMHLGPMESFMWVKGFDLAFARRNSKLGEEPELITKAKKASFLVIDDVGSEPLADNILFEIIDERYTWQRPTIITTGLCRNDFVERYGAALDRRLTEAGIGIPVEITAQVNPSLSVVKP